MKEGDEIGVVPRYLRIVHDDIESSFLKLIFTLLVPVMVNRRDIRPNAFQVRGDLTMLNKELTEVLGLVAEGRAVDPEPPANSSPGTGQLGLLPLKVSAASAPPRCPCRRTRSPAVEALGAYVVLSGRRPPLDKSPPRTGCGLSAR